MKTKPIKADFYLLQSKLESQYRILPESVYVKIHLPPYIENGKRKYRPYRFPVCKVIPKYFGKSTSGFKYDIATVYENRKNNVHFTNARDKIYDALIEIEKKYEYQLPSNETLIFEINTFIGRIEKTQNLSIVNNEDEIESNNKNIMGICLLSAVDLYIEKMITISTQNRIDSRSSSTIESYRLMRNNLKRYIEENGHLELLTLANEKWNRMWDVILTYKKGSGNYTYSSIQLQQKQLRYILKKLPLNDLPLLNLNDDLINQNIDPINQHTQLFLSENELKILIEASFDIPKMEFARKYLIIASLTGQRYQSMREMSSCAIEWNDEFKFFYAHFIQIKTGTHCYCPLFSEVVKLCSNNIFLNVTMSNSNLKYWIDKVVVELGIKKGINISSHTCKKTFVSLLKPYRIKNEIISLVTHPTENFSETCVADYDKSDLIYKSEMFYEATVGIVKKYPDTLFRY